MGKLVTQVPNEDPERLSRVLDARWRTIGVDKDALERQVAERKAQEQEEKARDQAFSQLSNHWADQLMLQQQEADRMRRSIAEGIRDFHLTNQVKPTRREWDLSRPDVKAADVPARVGDDDPRNGPASLQRFTGEDLTAGSRKAAQLAQSKAWWEEQAAQKAAVRAAQAENEQAVAELTRYQDWLQQQARAQEASARRELQKGTAAANQQLAEQRRLQDLQAKADALASNLAEIEAALNSPFLSEDPTTAASALSTLRVRKDHYKGMGEAERQAVLATQLAQVEEHKAKQAAQAAEDAQYARSQADIQHAMHAQAARVEEFRRQQMQKAQDVLRRQAAEKVVRDKAQAELYSNKIDGSYFAAFGTSHR